MANLLFNNSKKKIFFRQNIGGIIYGMGFGASGIASCIPHLYDKKICDAAAVENS